MFCLLTLAASPLHVDRAYAAKETEFGRNIVVGTFIYSLLLGMSVPDISGRAIANLGVSELRHLAPMFHGDTLYGSTEVLSVRLSASRPGQDPDGADRRLQSGRGEALQLHPLGPAALPSGGGLIPKGPGPLAGIRVVELATVVAGPGTGKYLADFGAEVVKVEAPGGDPTRRMGWTGPGETDSYFWKLLNRNKLAVTLDLKSESGRANLRGLLAEADVLIENMRPGKLEALGFGCDDLLSGQSGSWSSCG
jgi:hypothetical protein